MKILDTGAAGVTPVRRVLQLQTAAAVVAGSRPTRGLLTRGSRDRVAYTFEPRRLAVGTHARE